jgi:hypothetical protein
VINLSNINHSKENREKIAKHLVNYPKNIQEFIDLISAKKEEEYFKAAWALEFVSRVNCTTLLPYFNQLITLAKVETADQAIRPFAKIFETFVLKHYKNELTQPLSNSQLEAISEQCFDWLITDQKVAAKAYSMTTLYKLGLTFSWIHPELKMYLEAHFNEGSAAFKARAKQILKKL